MFYCWKTCQIKEWHAGHKHKECDYLSRSADKETFVLDFVNFRKALRFILKIKYEPGLLAKKLTLYNGKTKTIENLECNTVDMKDNPELPCTYSTWKTLCDVRICFQCCQNSNLTTAKQEESFKMYILLFNRKTNNNKIKTFKKRRKNI